MYQYKLNLNEEELQKIAAMEGCSLTRLIERALSQFVETYVPGPENSNANLILNAIEEGLCLETL